MDPNLTFFYANEGTKLDGAGAAFLGFLTTPTGPQENDPISLLRFSQTSDPNAVRTLVHQVPLEGRLAHHFVDNDGTLSLFGAIEFRRIDSSGVAVEPPVFSVWFDDFGSYGVSNKVGYVSGNPPSTPATQTQFRNAVGGALYQAVQNSLEAQVLKFCS